MNNNLIIFYHDESKDVYSFPTEVEEHEALDKFMEMRSDIQGEDIKKYFYITNDETPPSTYGNFYELSENSKLTMDLRLYLINQKIANIRTKRDAMLGRLDLPFMRSLEDEDGQVKQHIKNLKNFLRDMPDNLGFNKIDTNEDIIKYDPFGNVFEIQMIYRGSGYIDPPAVKVDPPKGEGFGFAAEAIAFIKDGEVTRVELIDNGCAYDYVPRVFIDPPEKGEQAVALCGPPQNINLSQEDIIENSKRYYL